MDLEALERCLEEEYEFCNAGRRWFLSESGKLIWEIGGHDRCTPEQSGRRWELRYVFSKCYAIIVVKSLPHYHFRVRHMHVRMD